MASDNAVYDDGLAFGEPEFTGDMTRAQIGQQLRISQLQSPGCSPARSAASAGACPACRSAHPAPVSPGHPAWI
jgi:hypothetical protein